MTHSNDDSSQSGPIVKPGCICLTTERWHWACPVCAPETAAAQAPLRAGTPRPADCTCGNCGFGDPATCQGDYDDDWARTGCPIHEPWTDRLEPIVDLAVKAPINYRQGGGHFYTDPSPRGPYGIPLTDPAYVRAIRYFGRSHDQTGGGQVAWLPSDLNAKTRAQIGLVSKDEGVILEVYASRLERVLVDLDELNLPVAFATLPYEPLSIEAWRPLDARSLPILVRS
jgi:hypothetical protein